MHIATLKTGFRTGLAAMLLGALAGASGHAASALSLKVTTTVGSAFNSAYMKKFQSLMHDLKEKPVTVEIASVKSYKALQSNVGELANVNALMLLVPTYTLGYHDMMAGKAAASNPATAADDLPPLAADFFGVKTLSGVTALGHFVTGPEAYVMKAPLHSLDALDGKRFRVKPSKTKHSLGTFGAYPLSFSFPKNLPVGRTTNFDGALVPDVAEVPVSWKKDTPNMVFNGAAYTSTVAMVSMKWFNKLSEKQRTAIRKAAREADKWATESTIERNVDAAKMWKAIGGAVQVIPQPVTKAQIDKIEDLPSDAYTKAAFHKIYSEILKVAKQRPAR